MWAMRENWRLTLLVINPSTVREGVRYFNPPLFPPACRDNPHPAHRGVFISVLFIGVDVLCEDVPGRAFLASPFGTCKGEEQDISPLTWEVGFSCFER